MSFFWISTSSMRQQTDAVRVFRTTSLALTRSRDAIFVSSKPVQLGDGVQTRVHPHSCPPIRARHTSLWTSGVVLGVDAKTYPVSYFSSSSTSMETGRSQVSVSWVTLKI